MLHPDIIDAMIAAGASAEVVAAACRAAHIVAAGEIKAKRSSANERQRKKRDRDREGDLFERSDDEQRYIDASIATDPDRVLTPQVNTRSAESHPVTPSHASHSDKRNPHKENTSSFVRTQEEVSGVGESRARDPEPLVSQQAHDMADAIATEAGFDLEFIPPGWCGAASHLQDLLTQGYSENLIRIGATQVLRDFKQKARPPPQNFAYFRKAIPNICADMRTPISKPEPRALEVINGGKSQPRAGTYDDGRQRPRSRNLGSATDALRELREYYTRCAEAEERPADGVDHAARGIPDGRLPPG